MLKRLASLLSVDMAIDLGTANSLVYVKDRGIIINEPSVVAVNNKTGQILAIGEEAKKMVGRTPSYISATRPLVNGVISDFEVTEQMLKYFIEKAVSLSPNKQNIRFAVAVTYAKLGQIEKAIDFAKQTYEINTDNDQAWTRYIQVAVLANKTDLVEGLINEAVASNNFYRVVDFMSFLIANNPNNPQLRANLSLAYAKAGDINSAIKELEKAKIDFPEGASKFDALIDQLKSGTF
jgi:tetratricopeptide (TPR) repeat protein